MTLVEISEREVIEAARAFYWLKRSSPERDRQYPTANALLLAVESAIASLFGAVALLEERERVAASITYPPMVEGQCHWEVGGKIVEATAECRHVAGNPDRDDAAKSGNDNFAISPGIPVNHQLLLIAPIARNPRKLSRREQEIEKRRQSDPMGKDRPEIDYSSIEDPSAR